MIKLYSQCDSDGAVPMTAVTSSSLLVPAKLIVPVINGGLSYCTACCACYCVIM